MKRATLLLLILSMIAGYCLTAQVAVNSDGSAPNSSAMLDVKSTDKGCLPPRLSHTEVIGISSPAEGLVVYNTTSKTLIVYNGSEWVDMVGNPILAIGDFHQGGVIFYLDGSGGGMICAVSDQDGGSGIQWYNGSYTTTGATGTAIGTGHANTTAIINNQGAGSYAATVCDNYTVGSYDDWFLPSQDELNEMYQNKVDIDSTAIANGGTAFSTIYHHWSSSEITYTEAWGQHFGSGGQDWSNKGSSNKVRAVRAF